MSKSKEKFWRLSYSKEMILFAIQSYRYTAVEDESGEKYILRYILMEK